MLFNSYVFIFAFLPITLLIYHILGKSGLRNMTLGWLVAASLFFYGWWNPAYLGFILISIMFNYALGISLSKDGKGRRQILWFGVSANMLALCYFKYANFIVDNMNLFAHGTIELGDIALPLAISFFTFQQITYLVDAYRGQTKQYSFVHYCLFVTFFPQLIAGPIVHHSEMLPQFVHKRRFTIKAEHLAIGLSIFIIGLFKKVVIADDIALYATNVFSAAGAGQDITFFEAWGGALAYTFQLYFDFSGYSDMAIGLARMFGIILPLNFNSPYKAQSLKDFWRRWHITLSRFLRDYVYIPLGGNRKGIARKDFNLLFTMFLGGLWHGAGWTFVIWGAVHGAYLVVENTVGRLTKAWGWNMDKTPFMHLWIGRLITFVFVVAAWVIFRAESLDVAAVVYQGMLGRSGISLPSELRMLAPILEPYNVKFDGFPIYGGNWGMLKLVALLCIVWFVPNTYQVMKRYKPALVEKNYVTRELETPIRLQWRLHVAWGLFIAVLAVLSIMNLSRISEFLYFQF